MARMDLSALWLSLRVATTATLCLIVPGLWLAWRLARTRRRGLRVALDTVLALPLVMPPTVVGYALLLILGRGTSLGRWLNDTAGIRLLFTWQGAALAAGVMALPLLVRAAAVAFAAVETELLEQGRVLGASEATLFRAVALPLAWRGVLAGIGLAFTRALGEFGATLMVAGNIPGQTRTLPLALYDRVLLGDDPGALRLAAVLGALTLALCVGLVAWERKAP